MDPMTNTSNTKVTVAARIAGLAVAFSVAGIGFAGAAQAAPVPHTNVEGMHGDPGAGAPYWRYQQQDYDCGEMAVADVVGQVTGREPTEQQINGTAENTPSVAHAGSIWKPGGATNNQDLPVLLAHYGIRAAAD